MDRVRRIIAIVLFLLLVLTGCAPKNPRGPHVLFIVPGAGGFAATQPHARLVQHAYDPQWRSVGNDGGHFGTLRTKFAHQVLRPLLE
ncbi:hypothetical protein [Fontivita pretiosa]|uniref:hypothetical protein n=1 Tax=Fontivita pretiosa TaxID=2989684 RepID=UPI003D17531E